MKQLGQMLGALSFFVGRESRSRLARTGAVSCGFATTRGQASADHALEVLIGLEEISQTFATEASRKALLEEKPNTLLG